MITATDDNAIQQDTKPVEMETAHACCCCCPYERPKRIIPTEITASSDQITIEDDAKLDLNIFISSLPTPPSGSKIIQDHGLISVIVGKFRRAQVSVGGPQNYYQRKLEADMAEMERARGLAFGKLRRDARRMLKIFNVC